LTGKEPIGPHVPVLVEEILEGLGVREGCVYLDGTVGAGGHCEAILANCRSARVIGMDRDPSALAAAKERLEKYRDRVTLIHGNFRDMDEVLDSIGVARVDGIILDLGVSSMHLDLPERGFSFLRNGPLDMRMDPSGGHPAWEIVNNWSAGDLARILFRYGEEKRARDIAAAIVRERKREPIMTTGRLAEVVAAVPGMAKVRNIHPATRTFQALRIQVNGELEAIEKGVVKGIERLNPGGRMAVISFHSLEDRIVKRGFREAGNPCRCPRSLPMCVCGLQSLGRVVTRTPVIPSEREKETNPRSRSGKLRIFEKKGASR